MVTCNGAQYCRYYPNTIKIVVIQYIVFGIITQTYPSKSLSFGDRREVDAFVHRNFIFPMIVIPAAIQ